MIKSYLSMSNILKGYLHPTFKPKTKSALPKKIEEWTLDKEVNTGVNFSTGIYKGAGGMVFVKLWEGEIKNSHYYRLKNELTLYASLSAYSQDIGSTITVPRLIKELETHGKLIGIIEYIDGHSLNTATAEEKIEHYTKVLEYLTNASDFISTGNTTLASRRAVDSLKLLPAYVLLSAYWHPKQILNLLTLTLFYLVNLRSVLSSKKLVLAHRDLHLENIVISAGKTYLIDLEYMVMDIAYTDLAGTMRLESNRNKAFVQQLSEVYANDIKSAQFITKSISVLIQWGLDDGFNALGRTYNFLAYCKTLVKHFVLLTLRAKVYSLITQTNTKTSILCYHGIDGNNPYAVSYTEFIKHIATLKEHYKFISLTEVLEGKTGVALTFDDGYASIKKVFDYLNSNTIPYTIFALADFAHANRTELDSGEELLTNEDLKELAQHPLVTIGCHTATHANLLHATDEQLEYEIIHAKRQLQHIIGKKVDYFAYPKGNYNQQIIAKVRQAKYTAAFSILPGSFSVVQNDLLIPRTVINNSHQSTDICAVISPVVQLLKKAILKLNLYGLINYERK
ncbi:MAG: hypothetical protein RLY61_872 [Candidatus Parcubacteria bacterium]